MTSRIEIDILLSLWHQSTKKGKEGARGSKSLVVAVVIIIFFFFFFFILAASKPKSGNFVQTKMSRLGIRLNIP
jgi:hypothetical protein